MIPLAYLDWPDEGTTTTTVGPTTTTAAPTSPTETQPTGTQPTETQPTGTQPTNPPCLNTYQFTFYDGGCNYVIRDCNGNPTGNIRVTSCSSPGTDSTGATIPGCSQNCPTEPQPTEGTPAPTQGTPAPTQGTPAPTQPTPAPTPAPCNCAQFDNQCPPGFTATCDSSCNFTGVCFG